MTPTFDRPPVVEVALGFSFAPRSDLGFRALTHLADRWTSEFPNVTELAAIPSEPPQGAAGPMVTFSTGAQPVRLWLQGADNGLLLQVQNDRLILNWRASETTSPYPGYGDFLRGEYLKRWVQLLQYFTEAGGAGPRPQSAEFTYVNSLPLAEGEEDHDIISVFSKPSGAVPGDPTYMTFQIVRRVVATDKQPFPGQVVVNGGPMYSEAGRSITLSVSTQVQLPQEYDGSRLIQALDSAHDISATAFAAVTTEARHKEWGRADV